MKSIFNSIFESLKAGRPLVLTSVIDSSGSTPRGAGALMLVHENGKLEGTIGGGAVEYFAQSQARKVLETKRSKVMDFVLAPNEAADLGMVCGGDISVLFQYLAGDKHTALFEYLSHAFDKNENTWLVRRIESGEVTGMGVFDNKGLNFSDCVSLEKLQPLLQNKAIRAKGDVGYYVEPVVRSGRVYIFGGGHVSQELVPVIAHVGFTPVVFEDREQFADKALFPMAADIIVRNYCDLASCISISNHDYVVVVTRGHQADFEVLELVMRTEATYIGCIGSKNKINLTKSRLLASGLTEKDIQRLHAPIGLDIKGETPAEIAISIAAEMILHRATKG